MQQRVELGVLCEIVLAAPDVYVRHEQDDSHGVREYSSNWAGTIQRQPATVVQISTKKSVGKNSTGASFIEACNREAAAPEDFDQDRSNQVAADHKEDVNPDVPAGERREPRVEEYPLARRRTPAAR